MAKPKKEVVIKVIDSDTPIPMLQIWANNLLVQDIMSIEGITNVMAFEHCPWIAYVDIRYDINEIAEELEELLLASISDISTK